MKIFIACNRLGVGGSERVAVVLANGFANNGHQVFLVSNLLDEITYTINKNVTLLPLFSCNKPKVKKWFSAIPNMRKHLQEYHPDVVIGIIGTYALISRIASIGMDIPIIMTEHNSFERPLSAPMNKWTRFEKFCLNKIYKYITVLTEADKRVIGRRLKNVVVMPNPLSLEPITTLLEKEKIILAAGRLDAWHVKGFDLLIEAWGRIASKHPDWVLQIAGSYNNVRNMEFLQSLVEEKGLVNRVIFLGFQKEIAELYKKTEIFVLSSRYEGFGLVLIEAMSQGCACIACDYKGRQAEIIQNQKEGIVCQSENVIDLVDAIEKLISNSVLRKNIQMAGIDRSKYYSIESTIERWEKYLSEIVCKS